MPVLRQVVFPLGFSAVWGQKPIIPSQLANLGTNEDSSVLELVQLGASFQKYRVQSATGSNEDDWQAWSLAGSTVHGNLGNGGPDTDRPNEIRYSGASQGVDLVITTTSDYNYTRDSKQCCAQNSSCTVCEDGGTWDDDQEKCVIYGDPHIIPFDLQRKRVLADPEHEAFLRTKDWHTDKVSFHEVGTFWLVKSKSIHIQGLYQRSVNNPQHTHLSMIAVGGPFLKKNMFVVSALNGTATWNGKDILRGLPSEFKDGNLIRARYHNDSVMVRSGEKGIGIDVELPEKVKLRINRAKGLAVIVEMPKQKGGQVGQCGNFNGRWEDDTQEFLQDNTGNEIKGTELLVQGVLARCERWCGSGQYQNRSIETRCTWTDCGGCSECSPSLPLDSNAIPALRMNRKGEAHIVQANTSANSIEMTREHSKAEQKTNKSKTSIISATQKQALARHAQGTEAAADKALGKANHKGQNKKMRCDKWCSSDAFSHKEWDSKCQWKGCMGCSKCKDVASTAEVSTPLSMLQYSNSVEKTEGHFKKLTHVNKNSGYGVVPNILNGTSVAFEFAFYKADSSTPATTMNNYYLTFTGGYHGGAVFTFSTDVENAWVGENVAQSGSTFTVAYDEALTSEAPSDPYSLSTAQQSRTFTIQVKGKSSISFTYQNPTGDCKSMYFSGRSSLVPDTPSPTPTLPPTTPPPTPPPTQCPTGEDGTCIVIGDPHIIPFDLQRKRVIADPSHEAFFRTHNLHTDKVNFHEVGTYWLVKSDDVHIQGMYQRSLRDPSRTHLSVLSVGGPFLGNNVLTVSGLNGSCMWKGKEIIRHLPSAFRDEQIYALYHNESEYVRNGSRGAGIDIEFPTGVKLTVNLQKNLAVKISMCGSRSGQTGQCGNYNGDWEDETQEHLSENTGAEITGESLMVRGVMARCARWCGKDEYVNKTLESKCRWKDCGGCSECGIVNGVTDKPAPEAIDPMLMDRVGGDCAGWCSKGDYMYKPWTTKCTWEKCGRCTECSATQVVSVDDDDVDKPKVVLLTNRSIEMEQEHASLGNTSHACGTMCKLRRLIR